MRGRILVFFCEHHGYLHDSIQYAFHQNLHMPKIPVDLTHTEIDLTNMDGIDSGSSAGSWSNPQCACNLQVLSRAAHRESFNSSIKPMIGDDQRSSWVDKHGQIKPVCMSDSTASFCFLVVKISQVHIILSRNWQSLVTKADWGAVLWTGFEKNTKNCQARCYMDVVVLLDCWTSIHLGQRTCSPSESLLQCIFLCLVAWTSLLVAYPKFLFATTIELIVNMAEHRPLRPLVLRCRMELDHSLLCHFSHIVGSASTQGFLETLKLDDPEDLKKSKGSGKTGSLGDRTMRELSLEDWDTLWNYMKLLWQLWNNKDLKCQTGLIHQHSSVCRSRFDMPPETQLRCFRCLIHFNHLDDMFLLYIIDSDL